MRALWRWLKRLCGSESGMSLGDRGELAAVRFLKGQGYSIVARRMRNEFGEIDIIATEGAVIVFIEVKTRTSTDAGQPYEAVNSHRQGRMSRAALAWLKRQRRLKDASRFDVISIVWPDVCQSPEITHLRGAFESPLRGQMWG